jgi:oligopeptide/dipeptide ABC transporter ATP-binding protein
MILISHDLGVIATRTRRVAVMYAGRIVEELDAARLQGDARHPYTRALLRAVPNLTTDRDQPLATIPGRPPHVEEMPVGCAFAARCDFATDRCRTEDPVLERDGTSAVACWHPRTGPVATGGSR